MTQPTRDLFDAFTRLPEAEQLAFAMEVLRWTTDRELPAPDDDDPAAPDILFPDLDPSLGRGPGRPLPDPTEEPPRRA